MQLILNFLFRSINCFLPFFLPFFHLRPSHVTRFSFSRRERKERCSFLAPPSPPYLRAARSNHRRPLESVAERCSIRISILYVFTYGRARITSFLGNHGQEVGRKIISPKAPGYTGFGMHGGRRRVFDEFRGKNSGRKKSFRRLAVEIGKIP